MKPRPFLRTHRPLPSRHSYTEAEIRAAGIRAVSAELDRRPIAEDVGRLTKWGSFHRSMFATEAVGG